MTKLCFVCEKKPKHSPCKARDLSNMTGITVKTPPAQGDIQVQDPEIEKKPDQKAGRQAHMQMGVTGSCITAAPASEFEKCAISFPAI